MLEAYKRYQFVSNRKKGIVRKLSVIASNLGDPAEILTHEVNGLLVTPACETSYS